MTVDDPKTYAGLISQPYANVDEANAAITAFFDDLREIRLKHRLPNVLMVLKIFTTDGGGFSSAYLGDSCNEESMAAYAYGAARRRRESLAMKEIGQ